MKKLICDFCGEETETLYDIDVVYNVKQGTDCHTFNEDTKEVCSECANKYNYESRKALERVYKKLNKKR